MAITYRINKIDNATITFYGIDGKNLFQHKIPSDNNQLVLDQINLTQGIYSYLIRVNGIQIKADKLVIIN